MTQNQPPKSQRNATIQLGIVGGGQLAQMMALEAAHLGLRIHILSEKESDPAAQVCSKWRKGNPSSRKDVMEFCKKLDLLTFESEFYDMTPYFEAQQQSAHQSAKTNPLYVFPSPEAMQILQSRDSQKSAMVAAGIPTAPYLNVSSIEELSQAWKKFSKGFVLKKCRGGYDGFGTYYCHAETDLTKLHSLFPGEFIAEELVAFKRELAVTIARGRDGKVVFLPLVESQQTQSRCDWVIGPEKHPGFTSFSKKLKSFLEKLNYVGCISFELFDTGKKLLVNEVAPRVHNSAHYSQNYFSQSQFLLHILAGLGEVNLAPRPLASAFCMVNLIGQSQNPVKIPTHLEGSLHWYGKTENRPGRKMGHVNYIGPNAKALLKKALMERKKFSL